MNIHAWVNSFVLTPARVLRVSVRTGNRISGPGVKSLLIVCCVCMGRMFELSLRDL